jgi:cell fate regulator YaaT (PSP1 superfamily)
MPDIVGVRFKKAGKVYYFDPSGVELKVYDHVVVQTARGVEMGQVTIAPKQVLASELTAELKPIVRKASDDDVKHAQDFTGKENSALVECNKLIAKLNLPMKLVSSEYNLDGSRLTFYFTADERVDFRELVRELTSFFKTRIELRQIGPRDQAKMVGGLGRCGRCLCCISFLSEFNPVSIKMAKEQDLPLDPMKISGVCGRLQCCLAYENQQYHEAKALMPRKGQPVETPSGLGVVIGGNPLKETVLVEMESKAEAEFPLNQIKLIKEAVKIRAVSDETEEEQNGNPVFAAPPQQPNVSSVKSAEAAGKPIEPPLKLVEPPVTEDKSTAETPIEDRSAIETAGAEEIQPAPAENKTTPEPLEITAPEAALALPVAETPAPQEPPDEKKPGDTPPPEQAPG